MSADSTHECPAPGCERRVPFHIFACRSHWFALPSDLQRRLTRAWRDDAAVYMDVRAECVAWLEGHVS